MKKSDISIVIVDDAKFSSALIKKVLLSASYTDIRVTSSAFEAIEALKARPAHILMADWIMPEIDGLKLTRAVRKLNQEQGFFTYVMLLTAKDSNDAIEEAFNKGVDDFISKTDIKQQLLPRTLAATRSSVQQNNAIIRHKALENQVLQLRKNTLWDTESGIGTPALLLSQVSKGSKQIAQRGGAIGLLTVRVENAHDIQTTHGHHIYRELQKIVAERLRQFVRPMDLTARVNGNTLAVLLMLQDGETCNPHSFKRVYEGMEKRSYLTSAGYLTIDLSVSFIQVNHNHPIQDPKELIQKGINLLAKSKESKRVESWFDSKGSHGSTEITIVQ
ncbi:response regulator [Gynuella sp.]|uniref:GGDEF domain-containing response regulator n=1 Tax=Gynuella sp. TaxID=2969146 RepID=UPI003D09D5C4